MAGREKQFNHDEALENALNVFWAKGFEATSMQELVDAMGVNRASMYQSYGNKDKLFNSAFDAYRQASLRFIEEQLSIDDSAIKSLKQLLVTLTTKSLDNNYSGCFVGNSAAELAPHNAEVAEKIRQFWLQLESLISLSLHKAVTQNELSDKADVQQLASFINSILQGLLIKTKANIGSNSIQKDIDYLFTVIEKF